MLPFWATLLINLALKLGLPWLEKHVAPEIAAIIEQILATLSKSTNQTQAIAHLKEHVTKACEGVGCGADLVAP